MNKKKQDYLAKTLGIQFVICLILFGVLFGLKSADSALFKTVSENISGEMNEFFSADEVKSAFSFNTFKGLESNGKDDEQTDIKSDEKYDVSEATTEGVDETEAETEGESLKVSVLSEGGVDVDADDITKLPDNVSFGKYKLNRRMTLPIKGTVTSEFGFRIHPITGIYGFHCGIDLAADSGTKIAAAFDGKVIFAGYDQWNGNWVKIQHADNIITVYCHCKKLFVKEGTVVRAGETIGLIGSTGNSTGPHLHFEFRINNISYNPEYALEGAVSAV